MLHCSMGKGGFPTGSKVTDILYGYIVMEQNSFLVRNRNRCGMGRIVEQVPHIWTFMLNTTTPVWCFYTDSISQHPQYHYRVFDDDDVCVIAVVGDCRNCGGSYHGGLCQPL